MNLRSWSAVFVWFWIANDLLAQLDDDAKTRDITRIWALFSCHILISYYYYHHHHHRLLLL